MKHRMIITAILVLAVCALAGCLQPTPTWTTLIHDVSARPTATPYVVELSVGLITEDQHLLDESAFRIEWDCGDGGREVGTPVLHDYVPGDYEVTITATDSIGRVTQQMFPLAVAEYGVCYLSNRNGMRDWSEDPIYQVCVYGWR